MVEATRGQGQTGLLPFADRAEAGRVLAAQLEPYRGREDVVVLALPRGGVPVAYEVARALDAPLDLLLVRKLGMPGQEELAAGAVAKGGVRVLNPRVAAWVKEAQLDAIAKQETRELERREHAYRGTRPLLELRDRVVILVDDGLATGASMRAAIRAARLRNPREVVVAVPVAPKETLEALRGEADEVVCAATPRWFFAIGVWYRDFAQLGDADVKELLQRAWRAEDVVAASTRPEGQ